MFLAVIHAVRYVIGEDLDDVVLQLFAFIPRRYDHSLLQNPYAGGDGAEIWTFITYSLLHADLSHLGFNVLWLLPFGSAVARRFGAVRFLLFMAVTAIAGAMAHLLANLHSPAAMIGASASVSGAMAAALRFAFVRGSFLSFNRGNATDAAMVPALSLVNSFRSPRVLAFIGIWFGLNILFGAGSLSFAGESGSVAWQAHIGGFVAGLILFGVFDPVGKRRIHNTPSRDL